MPILYIILMFVVVGVLLWLINKYVPMDAAINKFLNIAVIICMVIWFLQIIGIWQLLLTPVGHIR